MHVTMFHNIHQIHPNRTSSYGTSSLQCAVVFILFFRSFMWDDRDSSIKSLPPLGRQSDNDFSCYSCEMKALCNSYNTVRREAMETGNEVLRFQNNDYHVGDFVYLARPTFDAPDLFRVGQIRSLGQGNTIIVRKFKRKNSQISVCVSRYTARLR